MHSYNKNYSQKRDYLFFNKNSVHWIKNFLEKKLKYFLNKKIFITHFPALTYKKIKIKIKNSRFTISLKIFIIYALIT